MPSITVISRVVYRAPTAGRSFLTKRAASFAEARALIGLKYPSERACDTSGGWHFTEDERLVRLYHRLARKLRKTGKGRG